MVDEIFGVIARHVREVLPDMDGAEILPEHSLAQLGANSVDRAEIVMLAMNSLSLRIPRVETFGPRNLGELAELFHVRLQAR
jgi:polyketide biosynthesis acyl carrier protein